MNVTSLVEIDGKLWILYLSEICWNKLLNYKMSFMNTNKEKTNLYMPM